MWLVPGCPRCATPVAGPGQGRGWSCPEHGPIPPLWRPREVSYDAFAEHLQASTDFPTYLPWPVNPGWSVTDFAVVGELSGRTTATLSCSSGTSELDGPVDLIVVSEETGTGLGARCAGTRHEDPGQDLGEGPPMVRIRIETQLVPLWAVSTSAVGGEFDRSVVAGEANGRWLWIVLRPASAMMLLREDLVLRDVSVLGPPLLETPFGGPAPLW